MNAPALPDTAKPPAAEPVVKSAVADPVTKPAAGQTSPAIASPRPSLPADS